MQFWYVRDLLPYLQLSSLADDDFHRVLWFEQLKGFGCSRAARIGYTESGVASWGEI